MEINCIKYIYVIHLSFNVLLLLQSILNKIKSTTGQKNVFAVLLIVLFQYCIWNRASFHFLLFFGTYKKIRIRMSLLRCVWRLGHVVSFRASKVIDRASDGAFYSVKDIYDVLWFGTRTIQHISWNCIHGMGLPVWLYVANDFWWARKNCMEIDRVE